MILNESHRRAVFCVLWSAIALAGLSSAIAQTPPGPSPSATPAQTEMLPDPQIVIWADGLTNFLGGVAHNTAHDEFMAVWMTEQDQWSYDIWARRLRPDGALLEHFNVAAIAGVKLWEPRVAYCPLHDEYLMAYSNLYDGSPGRIDVQARRVAWNGGWMSDVFTISPEVANHFGPSIAYCGPCDEYVVTYTNDWGGWEDDLYAQRVRAADGALLDMNIVASGEGWKRCCSSIVFHPAMYGGTGGYLIAYQAEATEVRARYKITHTELYDLLANPEVDISSTSAEQIGPQAAAGQLGFLVVYWNRDASGAQVRARRINCDGVALGPPEGFPVSSLYTSTFSMSLAVTYAYPGLYLVFWQHEDAAGTVETHGIFVSEDADTTVGDEVVLDAGNWTLVPATVCSPISDCLVAYAWWNTQTNSYDIAGDIARLVVIFENGFESGDTSAWSATVP